MSVLLTCPRWTVRLSSRRQSNGFGDMTVVFGTVLRQTDSDKRRPLVGRVAFPAHLDLDGP